LETSIVPFLVVLVPVLAAFTLLIRPKDDNYRNWICLAATIIPFLLLLSLHKGAVSGGVEFPFTWIPGMDMSFRILPAGLIIALVTSFLWIVAHIFAISDMTQAQDSKPGRRLRFDFFSLLTLSANLGVLIAGDFITLFIFFEGLLILPYPLIAHREDVPAIRGANLYFYVGVATSLALLSGLVLLNSYTGTLVIQSVSAEVSQAMGSGVKFQIAALMVVGFGGKAGLFIEHFWLAEAHPVAPSPGHALLSGAMIKAGAYGIFLTVNLLFLPQGDLISEWMTLSNIGYVMIFVGVVTMFTAVISALITADYKRMLALHSVSQMGYIMMGIGCAAYLGKDGAMGVAGALYHIVNHALFKVALLLGGGAVYFRLHKQDMYKYGGLWRNMPLGAVFLFIGACGISGIPFFNGFASKTIIHHAILEAYEHSHDPYLKFAEVMFIVTAAGTFASNMKFFKLTMLGKRPKEYDNVESEPMSMKISLGLLAAAIVLIGLFPNFLLESTIGPALASFGFDPNSHAYQLLYDVKTQTSGLAILYPRAGTFSDVLHNLVGTVQAVILGSIVMYCGLKFGWFHLKIPKRLTFEYYATRGLKWLTNPWSTPFEDKQF
jgi:formate hydrogenlyase subunit 3/multisubunit Na+/H+ antiporter MnhD subunit